MDPIKPGTRCECDAEHGGPIHNRYQGLNIVHCQCKADAVRMVTVCVPNADALMRVDPQGQHEYQRSMCASCADFHEKAAK